MSSDGVLRLSERKNIEVLLMETSGAFGSHDKVKIGFDHHKGTFGTMAMLETIADHYHHADIDVFRKLKVFVLHGAGIQLHMWSLCYQNNGVYELWRETYLDIYPSFEDRADFLPDLLTFFWKMKELVKECIANIDNLHASHISRKSEFRYSDRSPPLLTDFIQPSIIKLTQHVDSKGMADLGPFYSPISTHSSLSSPNHS